MQLLSHYIYCRIYRRSNESLPEDADCSKPRRLLDAFQLHFFLDKFDRFHRGYSLGYPTTARFHFFSLYHRVCRSLSFFFSFTPANVRRWFRFTIGRFLSRGRGCIFLLVPLQVLLLHHSLQPLRDYQGFSDRFKSYLLARIGVGLSCRRSFISYNFTIRISMSRFTRFRSLRSGRCFAFIYYVFTTPSCTFLSGVFTFYFRKRIGRIFSILGSIRKHLQSISVWIFQFLAM